MPIQWFLHNDHILCKNLQYLQYNRFQPNLQLDFALTVVHRDKIQQRSFAHRVANHFMVKNNNIQIMMINYQ